MKITLLTHDKLLNNKIDLSNVEFDYKLYKNPYFLKN